MWIAGYYENATNFLCVSDISSLCRGVSWVAVFYCVILLWAPLDIQIFAWVISRSRSLIPLIWLLKRSSL